MKKFAFGVVVATLLAQSLIFQTSVSAQVREQPQDPSSPWRSSDAAQQLSPLNVTPQTLPFSQNWSNASLITTNNDWSGVPGIIGYRGDDLTLLTGTDPQTIIADGSATPVVVAANQTDTTNSTGGITEFALSDPVVALQGSGTADAPHIVLSLDTTGGTNIVVSYNLRDIDGTGDNAVQPVALQYRVGNTGSYTNIPDAFVADASSGPNSATLVTPVSVTLPSTCENQALIQLRIITANAVGSDEWIGIDDINVAAAGGPSSPSATGTASPNNLNAGDAVLLTVAVVPGSSPTSTGLNVEGDLTNIGGPVAQPFYDDGTNGDVTPGDNIFSFATNVAAGTAPGIKLLSFRVSDAEDRQSTGNIQLTVQGVSNPSGSGSASPNPARPGTSSVLTFTVVPGTGPTSTGIAVMADLSSVGGSSTQAFADAGNNKFTFTLPIPAGTPDGLLTFPVTITDAQARTGSGNIFLSVQANILHSPAEHEVMGNPSAAGSSDPNNWLIERNQYDVSYNCAKGIPNWVEWHIDSSWLGSAQRTDNYRAQTDIPLPAGCYVVQGGDYSGSATNGGFDRGHNVPSADRTDNVTDNDATFIMTNFIPQAPNNNQGIWNDMEAYIRSQVTSGNEVYTWMGNAGQGGIGLNGFANTVANGHVVVPAYVWRVVMVLPVGSNDLSRVNANTRVFAVLTPNIQTASGLNSNWMTYICPVSKIEQLTGMTFFPNVPAATATVLKQKIDPILAAQTVAAGTVTNLNIVYPQTYMTGNVTVTGTLALGPESLVTTNVSGTTNYSITLGPNATVTRLNSGMVSGALARQFTNSSTGFTYPVGTNDGYSPVTVSPTAVAVNPSTLTVTPHNITHPSSPDPANTLKRYWTLTESGDITANLLFKYLDTDVPAGVTESSLALHRFESSFLLVNGAVLDTSANTVTTTTPVSDFSDWTLMKPMAPASDLTVSGRITIPRGGGTGVGSAVVKFVDQQTLAERTVVTDATGHYLLDNVTSGTTFMVSVTARGLTFQSRSIPVSTSLSNQDFIGARPSNRDF